ncbi:hypothetical protein [Paenibacillus soyae]|uniref:Uncharacterized protein n=1 Tax=Paenibacillus soyae TaxID=2969249 RepID=A0A9X2MT60_9BACL|nr:hypothetical protein [Paenibacillus soyae]MCR2805336.1 hypothetical protein [Paenibacillus soyae]
MEKTIETALRAAGFSGYLAEYLARDVTNIERIMEAEGSDEEKREAVTFGVGCMLEKLEISGVIPEVGPVLRKFMTEAVVKAVV